MSKDQINLPKTAFSMKANLSVREPKILELWKSMNLYKELRESRKGKKNLCFMTVLLMQMETFTWEQL